MTTRDRLHRLTDALVDVLPDADAEALAPDDDETEAERAGVAEARADLAAGLELSATEVRAAVGDRFSAASTKSA